MLNVKCQMLNEEEQPTLVQSLIQSLILPSQLLRNLRRTLDGRVYASPGTSPRRGERPRGGRREGPWPFDKLRVQVEAPGRRPWEVALLRVGIIPATLASS